LRRALAIGARIASLPGSGDGRGHPGRACVRGHQLRRDSRGGQARDRRGEREIPASPGRDHRRGADYISSKKTSNGTVSITTVALTCHARAALGSYTQALRDLLGGL